MKSAAYAPADLIRQIERAGGQKTIYKNGADLRLLQALETAYRRGKLVRVSEDARSVTYCVPPQVSQPTHGPVA